jgi:hypothetical protein
MKMKKIVGILLALVVMATLLVGTSALAETESIHRDKYWEILDIEERENPYYDMIMYSEIGAKLREIEVASDRVKVEIIGKSGTAGYNLYQVIVSEPSAFGRLGEYQALYQMMIKDPERAQSMIEEGRDYKAPIYIYSTPHGNEAPGVDAAIMLIETLAYENTEEVMNILENCIVVVNVCANPEGRTALTRQNFAGFDMERDYVTQSQPEVRALVEQIGRWNPLYLLALHGFYDRYVVPDPGTGPDNPNLDFYDELFLNWDLELAFACKDALWENMEIPVWMTYYDWEFGDWDGWAPIYGDMYAWFYGIIGAAPETHDRGWDGVEAHYWVCWTVLNFAAENKDELMHNKIEVYRRGVLGLDTTDAEMPWAYLIPHESMQPSAYQLARGIDFLLFNNVQVHSLTSPVVVDGVTYPKGSYVVLMEQALRGLANTVLEDGYRMHDLFPGIEQTYDIAAWSHPRLWGYDAIPIEEEIPLQLSSVTGPCYPKGEIESSQAVAYALVPSENNYAIAVNTLLNEGIQVLYSEDGFTSNEREFVPGTVVVEANSSTLTTLVGDLGLSFAALIQLPEDLVPLRPLTIAACDPRNDPVSWVLSEELGFEVTRITEADLRDGVVDLADYDVFVNGSARWANIGATGQAMVMEFLDQGGEYIGLLNRGAMFANDAGILNTKYRASEQYENAILEVLFELDDPLASTYRERDTVYAYEPIWFTKYPDTAYVVASLPEEDFYMAGFWAKPEAAAGQAVVIRDIVLRNDEVVNGVVLMGIHPTFRAHPQKTFRLLANAIYWAALQ